MGNMLLTAIAAAAAALTTPSAPPSSLPNADPALWVVQDADTTVYLFGTFHTLDGRSEWFNDEVHSAFSASDELVLETLLPRTQRELQQSRAVAGHSVPSASFIGATKMAVRIGRAQGLDVQKGADMVLRKAAEDAGKPIQGLESIGFQLGMLRRMSAPAAVDRNTGQAPSGGSNVGFLISQMQASWNSGDQRIFTSLLDQMRRSSPANYRAMFPERNAHWADWVVQRMEQPGTVFVAVGAGHFAGPDSVLANLSSRGAVATRLN